MAEPPRISVAGIAVSVRRHGRARRITLRIGARGPVLTLPTHVPLRDAERFLRDHEAWLIDRAAKVPEPVVIAHGSQLPFAGQMLSVQATKVARPVLSDGVLEVPDVAPALAVRGFLIAQARMDLTAATSEYADQVGRTYGRITLRDTRSRWGSCTATGNLNYSWRLIMAPAEVLDYVAAHEVAHLCHMNHGARYWALVARICPDFEVYRSWLRHNGPDLHRYVFDA